MTPNLPTEILKKADWAAKHALNPGYTLSRGAVIDLAKGYAALRAENTELQKIIDLFKLATKGVGDD